MEHDPAAGKKDMADLLAAPELERIADSQRRRQELRLERQRQEMRLWGNQAMIHSYVAAGWPPSFFADSLALLHQQEAAWEPRRRHDENLFDALALEEADLRRRVADLRLFSNQAEWN